MICIYYDKIYTVPGIGRAQPGLPGLRAPSAWYQALPEQAQKACLLGALTSATDTRPGQREASRLRDIEAHHTARGGFQCRSLGKRRRNSTWYVIGPIQLSSKLVQDTNHFMVQKGCEDLLAPRP
jgi:hypothetical protein